MLATIRCSHPRHRGTIRVDDGCRQRGEIRVRCERCEVTRIDGELDTLRPVRISPICFSWEGGTDQDVDEMHDPWSVSMLGIDD